MSREWYLLKSPHSQISGYESDALNDFAEEGFEEALENDIAVDVELCNYDLSDRIPIRAIIQDNVQDTKLKTLSRQMLVPIGTCKAGMYVKYKNRYWIIVGLVDNNTMYEKAVLSLCNYLLTWLNSNGEIVQRWVSATSASQYNNGETGVKYYFIRTDQLMIITPDDNECLLLNTGTRFIIDKRCKVYEKAFDNNVVCDTSKSVITYEFTRADSVLYDYQDSGHFEFMAYQDEQHENDGYYVIDGHGYWLCDIPNANDKTAVLSCSIECDSNDIYNSLEAGIFTAKFYDSEGNKVIATPKWNVVCDFADDLNIEYVDNSICISADNKKLINKSFELSLSAEGYKTVTITVTIRAFM